MKRGLYYWLAQVAYKIATYHHRNFYKWREQFKKWAKKAAEGYITLGGADNADPD